MFFVVEIFFIGEIFGGSMREKRNDFAGLFLSFANARASFSVNFLLIPKMCQKIEILSNLFFIGEIFFVALIII